MTALVDWLKEHVPYEFLLVLTIVAFVLLGYAVRRLVVSQRRPNGTRHREVPLLVHPRSTDPMDARARSLAGRIHPDGTPVSFSQATSEREDKKTTPSEPVLTSASIDTAPLSKHEQKQAIPSVPVDLVQQRLVISNSLAPVGKMVMRDGAEPQLFLNDVELDHVEIQTWSAAFEFESEAPYRKYKTLEPAKVIWDASDNTGVITKKGIAAEL